MILLKRWSLIKAGGVDECITASELSDCHAVRRGPGIWGIVQDGTSASLMLSSACTPIRRCVTTTLVFDEFSSEGIKCVSNSTSCKQHVQTVVKPFSAPHSPIQRDSHSLHSKKRSFCVSISFNFVYFSALIFFTSHSSHSCLETPIDDSVFGEALVHCDELRWETRFR